MSAQFKKNAKKNICLRGTDRLDCALYAALWAYATVFTKHQAIQELRSGKTYTVIYDLYKLSTYHYFI